MPSPRVVLDTSTVVMPITRANSSHRWLLEAWQQGLITPLISQETREELLRVLSDQRFGIDNDQIIRIANQYLDHCEMVETANPPQTNLICRDQKDQKFITLAQLGKATYIVSADEDLLVLRDRTDEHAPETAFAIVRASELQAIIIK